MRAKKPIGLYLHIPFCQNKCNYCDFYSLPPKGERGAYALAVARSLQEWGSRYLRSADTVYLGGGTPNMLTAHQLEIVLTAANQAFPFMAGAEITCECNPGVGYATTVADLAALGINRLSVGLQSAVESELAALGRRHTPQDVKVLLREAKTAGISNCSVDLMWGIPGQTVSSALQSVDFALSLNPTHISAYLLKIEPDTPFGKRPPLLPDEDTVCDIYEACGDALEQAGFPRYEISNFARPGFESRHNCKYWNCEETLGVGPAAHSLMAGERFYYPRDLADFMAGAAPLADGPGGDFKEFAMLQLRLSKGLTARECMARFGHAIPATMLRKAAPLIMHGLMTGDEQVLRLTTRGNLVSNEILARLL